MSKSTKTVRPSEQRRWYDVPFSNCESHHIERSKSILKILRHKVSSHEDFACDWREMLVE